MPSLSYNKRALATWVVKAIFKCCTVELAIYIRNYFQSTVATMLDFKDDENQSPNVRRPQNFQKQPSKPKKLVSKLRPPGHAKTATVSNVSSNKSRLPPKNSDRYSFIRKAPVKKQTQNEATVKYVEPELKNNEDLVKPKTLNDVQSDKLHETATSQDSENGKPEFDRNFPRSQTFARKAVLDADAILELMHQKLKRIKRRSVQNECLSIVRDVERMALGTLKEMNESDVKVRSILWLHLVLGLGTMILGSEARIDAILFRFFISVV